MGRSWFGRQALHEKLDVHSLMRQYTENMRIKNRLVILLAIAFCSCSPVRVLETEADPEFALSQYKTFDFFQLESTVDSSEYFAENANLLKEAIARELQARGLTQSSSAPDLLVNIGITVKDKVQTRETNFRDAPRYMGQRNYTWKSEEIVVRRYKEGTVSVHLVESPTRKMVWNGVVAGTIPDNENKLPETIDEAMRKLFAELEEGG